jgi:hypothetical protein
VGQHGPGAARGPAQQGAQAGLQLFQVEGLGEVIVGAGVQPDHLVLPGVPGGEDEHRRGHVPGPQILEHGEAAAPGQAQVQHAGIVALGPEGGAGRLAVPDPVHGIAGQAQAGPGAVTQERVAFDQQDAHGVGRRSLCGASVFQILAHAGQQCLHFLAPAAVGQHSATGPTSEPA